MVNTIKWELRKQFHRSGWTFVVILVVFLILFLLPGSLMLTKPGTMSTVILILMLALLWVTISLLIYSISNLTSDFTKPTYSMERSTGLNYLKLFIVKFGFNIIYVLMSTSVVILGRGLISKFDSDNMKHFLIQLNRPYYVFMLEFAFFYPITLLFVYLIIKNVFQSRYIVVYIVLTAIVLYWSASQWKENKIMYLASLVILCTFMLYRSIKMAEKQKVISWNKRNSS